MSVSVMSRRGMAVLAGAVLLGLIGVLAVRAQDATPAKDPAAKPAVAKAADEKPAVAKAKTRAKSGGRLPAYYRDVVTDEQKAKIYAIQKELGPKIAELRKQLEALTAEQKQKIEAVLTPEQLQKVKDLEATAKKTRDAKKAKAK